MVSTRKARIIEYKHKILIACEVSGRVRDAFLKEGFVNTISCDLLPSESPGPHYEGDVRDILHKDWDLLITFPECTHIAVSGARYFKEKIADGRQQQGIDFFMLFAKLKCKYVIENPVGIMSSKFRRPDQIIQPFWFGEPESKSTCLWTNGMPPLLPTNYLKKPDRGYWDNQTLSGQNRLGPSADRAKIRGRTYLGIANAMGKQYGDFLKGVV